MLANDHSHAIVRGNHDPSQLAVIYEQVASKSPEQFFKCAELRQRVDNCPELLETIDRAERVEEGVIRGVVSEVPPDWMDSTSASAVGDFLVDGARGSVNSCSAARTSSRT